MQSVVHFICPSKNKLKSGVGYTVTYMTNLVSLAFIITEIYGFAKTDNQMGIVNRFRF